MSTPVLFLGEALQRRREFFTLATQIIALYVHLCLGLRQVNLNDITVRVIYEDIKTSVLTVPAYVPPVKVKTIIRTIVLLSITLQRWRRLLIVDWALPWYPSIGFI